MGKRTPTPTPPKEIASAQTGTNIGTAVANNTIGQTNQITPWGSQTYTQTGSTSYTDPYTGQVYQIPQTTMTQTLDPAQQAILDASNAGKLNMANAGAAMTANIGATPFNPNVGSVAAFNPNNEELTGRLYDLGAQRLDPRFAQERKALDAKLANQGIVAGGEAYNAEVNLFEQGRNDAYNGLLLNGNQQSYNQSLATYGAQLGGNQQAYNQAMGTHGQQLNDAMSLANGGRISQPNFYGPGSGGIATTDVASLMANSDAQKLQAYMSKQQMLGSALGAFGGLLSGI